MSDRIIDVRLNNQASNGEVNIRDEVIKGLSRPVNQKILPQVLLYNEEGLRIFDEITTQVSEYYIYPAEESLLKRHAHDIVQVMQNQYKDKDYDSRGGVVLELGAG
jgi:L-histidine Nalpha-methyltransferase / hercynylcysteine S-oxide synthase